MEGTTKRSIDGVDDSDGPSSDPPFIRYLFTELKHSCVFLVGDESEEIGVDKYILMAHSESLRLMLQDSALAEKGPVRVPDIQPDAFRNLLRFVYGHNILSTLTMGRAVDLMYVADKYIVEELRSKLSSHICSILSVDNVLIPFQRPECYEQTLLKGAINKTIQNFTDVLLLQKDFLDIKMFHLLKLLQQDSLVVSEIELWRGVLKWAKHNAKTENTTTLRELLSEPLKYLRLCTLSLKDFCKEVFITELLSYQEVSMIINSISKKKVSDDLTSVCNTIETRSKFSVIVFKSSSKDCTKCTKITQSKSYFSILTKESPIMMMSASFKSKTHSAVGETENLQFQCKCNISVTSADCTSIDCATKPVVEFSFNESVDYGKEFKIPFLVDGQYIELSPNHLYKFTFQFKSISYSSIIFKCSDYGFSLPSNCALSKIDCVPCKCYSSSKSKGCHARRIEYISLD